MLNLTKEQLDLLGTIGGTPLAVTDVLDSDKTNIHWLEERKLIVLYGDEYRQTKEGREILLLNGKITSLSWVEINEDPLLQIEDGPEEPL